MPLFFSPGQRLPFSAPADRKSLPRRLRPAPQRPGSDLRLLQSGQEEGGSPQSGAPESSSSTSRPGSAAARLTLPSAAPGAEPPRQQGPRTLRPRASAAAASGTGGAADPLAVQVSDALPGRPRVGLGPPWRRRRGCVRRGGLRPRRSVPLPRLLIQCSALGRVRGELRLESRAPRSRTCCRVHP